MTKTNNLLAYPINEETGQMLGYEDDYFARGKVGWRDNAEFVAVMQVVDWSRGRSSVKFDLVDTTTHLRYEMFVKDFAELVIDGNISKGFVAGTWKVVKRGQNYGLVKVESC